ncbi:hypothetical protein [Halogranum rubrum]|uniref:Uncharacterized protein n=1 Tax=Halogranum salarium B-1 TaxID=1210908 RepID=J3JEL5_9EURY|nr:hypothetical protein [Halogranum salarium]EJN58471.1 hypothetical protein HSB1_29490 [Halogranum salarium B-1]
MDEPHPVEIVVPAVTFTVAGFLIGGTAVGAVVGAVVGIALGAMASVAGHGDEEHFVGADAE